jgi:hypothetical protein
MSLRRTHHSFPSWPKGETLSACRSDWQNVPEKLARGVTRLDVVHCTLGGRQPAERGIVSVPIASPQQVAAGKVVDFIVPAGSSYAYNLADFFAFLAVAILAGRGFVLAGETLIGLSQKHLIQQPVSRDDHA